ncbi:MAG: L-erythro-3,5-diaminohexanoate dehydrogenase [Candidatus Izemoplasmatales bacterium]
MTKPCPYGTHRVLSPAGALPQAADVLDNRLPIRENELLIAVETLNVDSASFHQIMGACGGDEKKMAEMIMDIVTRRGKLQNPVTGSGGMLLGTVREVGSAFPGKAKPGDRIATLVSLSLTPLSIRSIRKIHMENDQVDVDADAILFSTGIYAKIPADLDQKVVMSALDVAGAPAQVHRLVNPGSSVLILGASGKSGVLCAFQAKLDAGPEGHVVGVVNDLKQLPELEALHACDEIVVADARDPMDVYRKALEANGGRKYDLTVNVVNVAGTEMASILPTRDDGIVYFFSMATSFSRAALGAEGVASGATMMIGNGYTAGHADFTIDLIRKSPELYRLFRKRYGGKE